MIIMHHVTYHCMAWQSRCYRSARIMRGTLSCVIDFQVSYPISRDLISALQIHLIFAREKTRLILIRNGPFVMHAVCRRIYISSNMWQLYLNLQISLFKLNYIIYDHWLVIDATIYIKTIILSYLTSHNQWIINTVGIE